MVRARDLEFHSLQGITYYNFRITVKLPLCEIKTLYYASFKENFHLPITHHLIFLAVHFLPKIRQFELSFTNPFFSMIFELMAY